MNFTEIPYVRPDLKAFAALVDETVQKLNGAQTAQEQIDAYKAYEAMSNTLETQSTVCYIRHSVDTRDEFYAAEQDWFDEIMPQVEELSQKVSMALLASKFRKELGEAFGELLFTNLEIQVRSFKSEMMDLMMEENKLSSQYEKLYAAAQVEFDGKILPIPKLAAYKESRDRAVRKAAYEAEGRFFDEHRQELDEIYDKLIKNRTAQAKLLGQDNFLQLGYDRLGRNCYTPKDVAAFREQIARDMVPLVAKVKEEQRQRLGYDHMYFYDDLMLFADGNARPQGTPDEILKAGNAMYHGLSPETAEFADLLFGGGYMDVLSKDGKAPGGYCADLPDYKAPFIFSNFNGTAGDVDVLTHEAGHAFAAYRAFRNNIIRPLQQPTMEACECHSMSMEFLTQDYHKDFFGPQAQKYEVGHCEDGLIFIPYGCMVDEFQHKMYENPDLTPDERNEIWANLEKKYRPWLDFGDLPFYSRGAGWQRQMHIYQSPFYYIDYCMAQTVAFQFWIASLKDRKDAWKRYLSFVDKGGTCTFEQLVHGAGLKVPYEEGCIKAIGEEISRWLSENRL